VCVWERERETTYIYLHIYLWLGGCRCYNYCCSSVAAVACSVACTYLWLGGCRCYNYTQRERRERQTTTPSARWRMYIYVRRVSLRASVAALLQLLQRETTTTSVRSRMDIYIIYSYTTIYMRRVSLRASVAALLQLLHALLHNIYETRLSWSLCCSSVAAVACSVAQYIWDASLLGRCRRYKTATSDTLELALRASVAALLQLLQRETTTTSAATSDTLELATHVYVYAARWLCCSSVAAVACRYKTATSDTLELATDVYMYMRRDASVAALLQLLHAATKLQLATH